MNRLEGKIAIVTGSSSGIGKAVALHFGKEGAQVVVAARRTDRCEQVVRQIMDQGGKAKAFPTDVTDENQVQALIDITVREFGGLDILINNAGIGGGNVIAQTETADFDRVVDTNLRGTFFCCRAGIRQMMDQKRGVIINMSSITGVQGWTGTGAYGVSKHGLMGLTRALADEARTYGVKVSAICPAGVADDLVDASGATIDESCKINPFDIAETAVYLATLGPHSIVREIIVDRLGAEW